jgi:hypothetical protein
MVTVMRGLLSGGAAALVVAAAIAVAALSSGFGSTATAYDPPPYGNNPPDCSGVIVTPSTLSTSGKFVRVTLSGATDTDGDELSYHIDGVTQDEPVFGPPGTTGPDAQFTSDGADSPSVFLRAEKDPRGNGRVYFIEYTVSDGSDSCSGEERVSVPRKKGVAAVADSSRWDSFTGAPI